MKFEREMRLVPTPHVFEACVKSFSEYPQGDEINSFKNLAIHHDQSTSHYN